MSKPKKKIVTDMCDSFSPGEFEGTLADVRGKINDLIDEYGPVARLDWNRYFHYDYDAEPSPRFELYKDREETDAELDNRIATEAKQKADQDKRDREELARLKKKLGEK